MSIDYKDNVRSIVAGLSRKRNRVTGELMEAMKDGMFQFQSHVQANQMTGRKSDDYGLNVQTGALRRSWRTSTNMAGANSSVTMSSRSKYAKIHQYGGTIKHPGGTAYFILGQGGRAIWIKNSSSVASVLPRTRPHDIKIPKRLHIHEEFKTIGIKGIAAQVKTRLTQPLSGV